VLCSPGVRKLKSRPATIPPLLIRSGIMKNSRSTNVVTMRMERITQTEKRVGIGTRDAAIANRVAVSVSTIR
jgi:hypothetical protein